MMPRIHVVLLTALACALASPLGAQLPRVPSRSTPREARALDSVRPAPVLVADTAIPGFTPSQVPLEADRAVARAFELSAAGVGIGLDEVLASARALADSMAGEERVVDLAKGHLLTRRGLADLSLTWQSRNLQVRAWRRDLSVGVRQIDSARAELDRMRAPWTATAAAQDSTVNADLRGRTAQVLDELHRVDSTLAARANDLLEGELLLSNAGTLIFGEQRALADAGARMREELLRLESPPLWRSPLAGGSMSAEARGGAATAVPELRWFVRGYGPRLALHLLLTVLACLVILGRRNRVHRLSERTPIGGDHFTILRRPIAAVLLVSLSLVMVVYPRAPLAVYDAMLLVSTLPLLLVVPELLPADLHLSARVAIGLLIAQRLGTILALGTPVFRLVQLVVSVAGAALLWRAVRPGGALDRGEPRWRLQLRRLAWLLLAVFVVAIVSNVVGNVSLADTLNSGVALSLFLGLLLHAVTKVVDLFVSLLIEAGATESRYLAQRGDRTERVVVRTVNVVAVVIWLTLTLRGFMIWEPIANAVDRVLSAPLSIGEVSLNLDMVLLFLLVLFVGNLLARMVSGVVELDVMGRMDLRRGVAVTMGSLLRYALIAVAFLVAIAAIGIDLGNVAILGGALGVGIGFGMQNIVNNFISGLLLAFERPIGIGDTVQVGPHLGDVKEIGIRASVIRTPDGAEVVVPNSDLITKDVVNWTRTSTRRRVEVAVNVAYGTDPERVLKLLREVAEQHPEVRANPVPVALFMGFGDSALNFVLRAWTDSLDWIQVRSDLTVGTNTALRDACIEVPFPQRDLHLRSVDVEALKDLRGEASEA